MSIRKVEEEEAMVASTLGSGLAIQGRVSGDGNLAIEGSVEGDVAVGGGLYVAPGGRVHGSVAAAAVTVGGDLDGDIVAAGPVHALAGSKLRGNVKGEGFSMDEGAEVAVTVTANFDMPAELRGARQ